MSRLTVFLWMFTSLFTMSQSSFASIEGDLERSNSNPNITDNSSINPQQSIIIGEAKFERRFTRVLTNLCLNQPCPESESYWSLVVETADGTRYLLNERLSLGATRAPEFITLTGVTVREGSRVRVEGSVVPGGTDLFFLLDVKNVTLLKDLGWSCKNVKETDPKFSARVWYEFDGATDGMYKIRIQQIYGRTVYPVAFVEHAVATTQPDHLFFKGASSNNTIELGIEQDPTSLMNLPATLKIVTGQNSEAVVDMTCSRTRFQRANL